MSKTVVVTGGTGYIGSHVARAFKLDNPDNKVHIIDLVRREHALKGIDGFLGSDFVGVGSLNLYKELQPDIIVHCAGTSLVGPSMINPSDYYSNNVSKTISFLNFIKDFKKKPIILFSSSASVYGEPKEIPVPESHSLNPISPYGNTKRIIETVLNDYSRAYGISSTIFRYFNAAGAEPNSHDLGQEAGATHIVARALEASLNNNEFIINGNNYPTPDGTCIRDYIHVWDLAIAHIRAADYTQNNPGCHIFNLGTNKGTSNQEIANYVKEKYSFKSVSYGPKRPGDPSELVADASMAMEKLTWTPKHSKISNIIDDAYRWYQYINGTN